MIYFNANVCGDVCSKYVIQHVFISGKLIIKKITSILLKFVVSIILFTLVKSLYQ